MNEGRYKLKNKYNNVSIQITVHFVPLKMKGTSWMWQKVDSLDYRKKLHNTKQEKNIILNLFVTISSTIWIDISNIQWDVSNIREDITQYSSN